MLGTVGTIVGFPVGDTDGSIVGVVDGIVVGLFSKNSMIILICGNFFQKKSQGKQVMWKKLLF